MPTSLGNTILYAAVIPNKDPSKSRPKDRQKRIRRLLWATDAHTVHWLLLSNHSSPETTVNLQERKYYNALD